MQSLHEVQFEYNETGMKPTLSGRKKSMSDLNEMQLPKPRQNLFSNDNIIDIGTEGEYQVRCTTSTGMKSNRLTS